MKLYSCQCGNRLFFENVQCVACRRTVGWCEACGEIGSFTPLENGLFECDLCHNEMRKCYNYEVEQVCNRLLPVIGNGAESTLCNSCTLTQTIPDLSVTGNRDKWRRLEQAKTQIAISTRFPGAALSIFAASAYF